MTLNPNVVAYNPKGVPNIKSNTQGYVCSDTHETTMLVSMKKKRQPRRASERHKTPYEKREKNRVTYPVLARTGRGGMGALRERPRVYELL